MHLKILSVKLWPFCPGGDELRVWVLPLNLPVLMNYIHMTTKLYTIIAFVLVSCRGQVNVACGTRNIILKVISLSPITVPAWYALAFTVPCLTHCPSEIWLKCKKKKFNSAPRKFEWNFRQVIFKQIFAIDGWGISCEIALIWMSMDFTDDQSTLVQVMAWCRQATSHYLSQFDPDIWRHMASLGHNELNMISVSGIIFIFSEIALLWMPMIISQHWCR